ncbi:LysM peptidoglycan-binding domain-containing protein [Streptomyces sp. WMMC500]|uniref:transglycosylase SLT domain-containing protein n=1 Tax=Streptomyces sp. WMMC500 TaxID=3015154 RepID=UPI00248C2478|nr:LysM peptidoglycan-binding domain-containing protein [Streptomyces sp. WMMC500]WBB62899.1 LysM peptidoglycan-binding domain-containing protein [Streptomyces sp. WMMC500]
MPAKGKHRRPKLRLISRGVTFAGVSGVAIAVPLIGASAASAAGPAPQSAHQTGVRAEATAAGAAKAEATTYAVVAGDSLAKIADKQGVPGGWEKLYEDNREAVGDNPDFILPGLELALGGKADTGESKESDSGTKAATASVTSYPDNLDGWIRESLDVMAEHGIPGTYEGIHRNIMRESGGDPQAINNWDINAVNGTPSKGLLQVIAPTFEAYHVPGTSTDSYDPVANITAACNYAADRYGSIDNVFGPY